MNKVPAAVPQSSAAESTSTIRKGEGQSEPSRGTTIGWHSQLYFAHQLKCRLRITKLNMKPMSAHGIKFTAVAGGIEDVPANTTGTLMEGPCGIPSRTLIIKHSLDIFEKTCRPSPVDQPSCEW